MLLLVFYYFICTSVAVTVSNHLCLVVAISPVLHHCFKAMLLV